MSDHFDPYHKWLGISPKDQPPDHYRLLAIDRYESDLDVIASAADRQMGHVRSFQSGKYSELSQQILNEISQSRVCLLNSEKKAGYDADLRAKMDQGYHRDSPPPLVSAAASDVVKPPPLAPPIAETLPVHDEEAKSSLAELRGKPDLDQHARSVVSPPPLDSSEDSESGGIVKPPPLAPPIAGSSAAQPGKTGPTAFDWLPENTADATSRQAVTPTTEHRSQRDRKRKKSFFMLWIIVLLLLVGAGIWLAWSYQNEPPAPDDPAVGGNNSQPPPSGNGPDVAPSLLGTGADGPRVVNSPYMVDWVGTVLTQSAESGNTTISIGSTEGFDIGDEILIINMQGGSSAGEHEFKRIKSKESNSLELVSGLVHSYETSDKIAVQRVPNFTDVTIEDGGRLTANAWNGATGGIVAFRASGVVHIKYGGSIHANSLGFRGGSAVTTVSHADGSQGESYVGRGSQGNRYANGGGGGAGNYASSNGGGFKDWGCGGAGGGYGSNGSNGIGKAGYGFSGQTCGAFDLSLLLLGSGGGSGGSDDDGGGSSSGGAGGAGGGIVYIAAESLVLSGSLSATGENGSNAIIKRGEDESGGGGGGSGGSVLLILGKSPPYLNDSAVVRGGQGGGGFCRGGNGGYGVLHIDSESLSEAGEQ